MSRFVQLEGRLTLTGANADRRIRVRDSHLARVAAALAHELIVVRTLGPLAADAEVGKALAPFAIDAVAAQAGLDAQVLKALAGELAAAAGKAIVMAGGSAGASASGPAIELAALLLNITLGAFDAGLFDEAAATEALTGGVAALSALVEDMATGRVEVLIVAGVNPVYNCPAFAKASAGLAAAPPSFAEALAKVPFVLSLNDRLDETSLLADLLAPASHPFECWSDATLPKGLVGIQQPVIQPLHDTRGLLDVLVEWGAAAGDPTALAAATAATAAAAKVPLPATAAPALSPSPAWHYLRAAWAARLAIDPATPAFEAAWNEVLRTACGCRPPSHCPRADAARHAWRDPPRPARLRTERARSAVRARAPAGPRQGWNCSSTRTSRSGTGAGVTTAGSTSFPIRSRASPGAGRSPSLPAGSTRWGSPAATSSRLTRATRRSSRPRIATRGCTTTRSRSRSVSAGQRAAPSARVSGRTPFRCGSSRPGG